MRSVKEYTIFNDIGIKTATFTAAVTDILTANSHGLKAGDMIVFTTSGTLPGGLALATIYYVRDVTTNTFKVSPTPNTEGGGPIVDITSTQSGGTHTFTMHDIGKSIFVEDFRHAVLAFSSDGGGNATMTVKIQGSIGDSVDNPFGAPDFSAAASKSNQWEYLQIIDLNTGIAYDGDTGFAFAGADDSRIFSVNVDGSRWLNAIISGWSNGEVTLRIKLWND